MEQWERGSTFAQLCDIIDKFAPCMNDYLYAYDITNDTYYISEKAVERFALPSNLFHEVVQAHETFVYADDVAMLTEDLGKMLCGEKESHNIKYRWIGRDGQPIWINCRGRIYLLGERKEKFLLGCINEIGARQAADNVSNLLGENTFKEHLMQYHSEHRTGYILRVGIDDIKDINERFGMEYGDHVLRVLADCMKAVAQAGQQIYRILGDEFIFMDYCGGTIGQAVEVYNAICRRLETSIEQDNYRAVYTISGGIVTSEHVKGLDYSAMMKISQFALSQAKNAGKNQVYLFEDADYQKFLRRRNILRAVRQAVGEDFKGFELYFQPIMEAGNGQLFAAETLLRFHMSEHEMLSPVEFIPVLEDSGLIIPVGKWILKNALAMCRECQQIRPDFKISVNVSYIQILKSQILEEIIRSIEDADVQPESVITELTESGHVEDNVVIQELWDKLKEYGVYIALDDFGTGYSNLQNIGNMAPHIVKLDRSFTLKALQHDYENQLMLCVIRMVHSIGLKICVEGVETKDELARIRALGPDYIQGYYYGKPCPREEFLKEFIRA